MGNYESYFTEAVKEHYSNRSDFLLTELSKNFLSISADTTFARTSRNPIDRRLDFCAYFLALIKTLHEQGESFDTIRQICLNVILEYVRPKNKIQLLLKRLPAKLANTWLATVFLKSFDKKVSRKTHPDGFRAEIITDKKETFGLGYGVDIMECGVCKLFKKHKYEKYTSILCEVDEITAQLAGLKLVRTGTIALGAQKCDFRFRKENLQPSVKSTTRRYSGAIRSVAQKGVRPE